MVVLGVEVGRMVGGLVVAAGSSTCNTVLITPTPTTCPTCSSVSWCQPGRAGELRQSGQYSRLNTRNISGNTSRNTSSTWAGTSSLQPIANNCV